MAAAEIVKKLARLPCQTRGLPPELAAPPLASAPAASCHGLSYARLNRDINESFHLLLELDRGKQKKNQRHPVARHTMEVVVEVVFMQLFGSYITDQPGRLLRVRNFNVNWNGVCLCVSLCGGICSLSQWELGGKPVI